ncbi:MAG: hypothetical protein V4659_06545 [Pseudomonadota bacterium]
MTGYSSKRDRDTVFLMARIAEPGAGASRYRVRNMSPDGVCIEQPTGLEKFKRLIVSVGQLDNVAAEVAWARGGFAGLKFMRPIDIAKARKHRVAPTDATAGWLSDHRRPHQRVYG